MYLLRTILFLVLVIVLAAVLAYWLKFPDGPPPD